MRFNQGVITKISCKKSESKHPKLRNQSPPQDFPQLVINFNADTLKLRTKKIWITAIELQIGYEHQCKMCYTVNPMNMILTLLDTSAHNPCPSTEV